MKKYLIIPFLFMSSLFAYPQCSPELQGALQTIYQFPEGKKLLEEVEAEGPISIHWARFKGTSGAMWVTDDRAIVINANARRSYGEIIRSIFFELHNAKTDKEFSRLDWLAENHRISKSDFVESIERIEHQNACRVSSLINKAIQQGYFPASSKWNVPPDFETHYTLQKDAGHSGKIGSLYESLTHDQYYGCR